MLSIITDTIAMQNHALHARSQQLKIALVPTMGNLHQGHLSLLDLAIRESDLTIISIFVNPTQFGPNEDFSRYPRTLERDTQLISERIGHHNVAIFHPAPSDIYAADHSTWIDESQLSLHLCGASRPGHFRGVCTIVAKLFNLTLPHVAIFGQKDAQQALIIQRMIRDLNFPLRIMIAPIVREPDGLAMSSRNQYLSPEERRRALSISVSLQQAAESLQRDASSSQLETVKQTIRSRISDAGGSIDYVEILDSSSLTSPQINSNLLVAVAAKFGSTRLIDNVMVQTCPTAKP